MKILHLITTLDRGGTEIQLAKLLARMDRARLEHCVVSLVNAGPVGEMIRSQGIPVYGLGMRRSVPSLSALWKLWSLIRIEQPQILQTWLYHADLLGLLVGKLAHVPALAWNLRCSSVDMQHYPKVSELVLRILSRLSGIPDVVVVNSQAGRLAHVQTGYHPKRFEVIPNGFELEHFRPDASAREWLLQELKLPKDVVIVGLIARYDPMKDHKTFLSAARLVHASHPDVYFVLCGAHVDVGNPPLARLVEGYGLSQYVRLLGLRQDIPRITPAFDIACSSSAGEGFCNAIGEAMASCVPCVVTDVGDSAQIVGHTGKVVPPRDPHAFAKALSELIECGPETRKRLGVQARARIAEQYDINQIAVRYEQLYQLLWSTASRAARSERDGPHQSIKGSDVQGNIDHQVVRGFGDEWTRLDQLALPDTELRAIFDQYFRIFPWDALPSQAVGFDLGCGSGRWARCVAPKVACLHCIDPSEAALGVAKRHLRGLPNCVFHVASVDRLPMADNSMDFGYALGVLHHIPDTAAGIRSCVMKLKVGAPLLLYLYYAFDNRPRWFRIIWRASDLLRRGISRSPFWLRYVLSQIIALAVYFPLARFSFLLERLGFNVESIPLSWYRRRSFYTIRTDSLDRLGTRLEKRFTAREILHMMKEAGLERVTFSDAMPYWCVIGFKKPCAG